MKLTFKRTAFHTLNKHWSQGISRDFNVLDYFVCGVSTKDVNRSSHNSWQSLITSSEEVFSDIPREAAKWECCLFWLRLEEVIGAKGDFT